MFTVVKHEELENSYGPGSGYRRWRFWVSHPGQSLLVCVDAEDGQYDFLGVETDLDEDEDEELQVAIGEFMEKNGIDPGVVHR